MSTKPFTPDEIIQALAIKFAELRTEAQASEQRLRAEFETEIAKLRDELKADAPAGRRGTKWKPVLSSPEAMIA